MSAIPLTLLTAAAVATVLGGAALHTAHGVRRELVALRSELASADRADGHQATTGSLPPHRHIAHASARLTPAAAEEPADGSDGIAAGRHPLSVSGEEIRAAVAEALAEERERELDEARAFWAAQEARGMEHGNGSLLAGHGVEYEVSPNPSELEDALLDALADGRLDDHPDDEPAPGDPDLPEPPRHEGEIFIPRQNGPSPFTSHDPGGPRGGTLPGPGADPTEAGGASAPGGRIPEPRTPGDGSGAPGHIPESDRIPAERRRDGMRLDKRRGDERGDDDHRAGGHERPRAERRPLDPDGHPGGEPPRNSETDGETTVPVQHPSRERADRSEHPESAEREESSELAAARRRHPSDPNFDLKGQRRSPDRPGGSAAGAEDRADAAPDHERTVRRLTELAHSRVPLADVRPGPLGTLDVYLFQDGSTVCLSPAHSEVSQRLARALHSGDEAFLLGGSTVAGAFALTFSHGEGETVYLLAERVIASP